MVISSLVLLAETASTDNILKAASHPFLFKGIGASVFLGILVYSLTKRVILKKKQKKMQELVELIETEGNTDASDN